MTGIEKLDRILEGFRKHENLWCVDGPMLATLVEKAVNEFLESKKSFFCTNTECPLKIALRKEKK